MNISDSLLEIMVLNSIIPIWRSGKVCFVNISKVKPDIKKEINSLKFNSKDDVDSLRAKIIERKRRLRTNIPLNKRAKLLRPREMFLKYGAENLSIENLLSIILRTGVEGKSANDIAIEILSRYDGSLRKLSKANIEELKKIKGLGDAKIVTLMAVFEIAKRYYEEKLPQGYRIKTPDDAINYIKETKSIYLRDEEKEHFIIILLNIRNKIINTIELSKGSSTQSVVDIKEIVKNVSEKLASSVVLIHNHPSGDLIPSENDIKLTRKVVEALKPLGSVVLDHIIIGKNNDFFSFAKEKLI